MGVKKFDDNDIPENVLDLVIAYVLTEITFGETIILFLDRYRNTIS